MANKYKLLTTSILICLLFTFSQNTCQSKGKVKNCKLKLIASYELEVPEPSGLTFGANSNELWTVSDSPDNSIYRISTKGKILEKLDYEGDDIEGICYDRINNTIWIADEDYNEIIHINLKGKEIGWHDIDIKAPDNNGLEGITIMPNQKMTLITEKNPGRLIEMENIFTVGKSYELDFALDYSGVCYDEKKDKYWILSDESSSLYLWDSINGVTEIYSGICPQAEGIAIDFVNSLIFIVSDSEERLYVYEKMES
jgi:uncharacterized protein YjiK